VSGVLDTQSRGLVEVGGNLLGRPSSGPRSSNGWAVTLRLTCSMTASVSGS